MVIDVPAEGTSSVEENGKLNPNRLKDIFTKLSLQFIEKTVILYSDECPVKIMMRLRAANEVLYRVFKDKKYVFGTKAPPKAPPTGTNSSQTVIRNEKPEQAPEKIGNTVGTSYSSSGMTVSLPFLYFLLEVTSTATAIAHSFPQFRPT